MWKDFKVNTMASLITVNVMCLRILNICMWIIMKRDYLYITCILIDYCTCLFSYLSSFFSSQKINNWLEQFYFEGKNWVASYIAYTEGWHLEEILLHELERLFNMFVQNNRKLPENVYLYTYLWVSKYYNEYSIVV